VQSVRYPPQRGTKYPAPAGIRGYGPGGVRTLWGIDGAEYLRRADVWPLNPEGELFVMVMVESPTAIRNLPDILDVPGIGAVFVGASDLSMNLGVGPPAPNSETPPTPELDKALTDIAGICRAKKVICGLAANWATKTGREKLIARGYRILL
jgi:4-hydroxy-2-oxoheptanedioate aldolase